MVKRVPRSARVTPALAVHVDRDGAFADHRLDEVESVARIGSYSLDIPSGRWVSSRGLDTIFGIDAPFDRTVAG